MWCVEGDWIIVRSRGRIMQSKQQPLTMFDVDIINDLLFQCDAIQGYGATLGKPRPLPSVLDSVVFQQTMAYLDKPLQSMAPPVLHLFKKFF